MLEAIVYCRSQELICEQFEERFKKKISKQYISKLKHDPNNRKIIERFMEEYERSVQHEYFSSQRNRVRAVTELYDLAMVKGEYRLALEAVRCVNEFFQKRETKFGDVHFVQFTQNNKYASMPLPEIKAEIARLAKMVSYDTVSNGGEQNAGGNGETEKNDGHSLARPIETVCEEQGGSENVQEPA